MSSIKAGNVVVVKKECLSALSHEAQKRFAGYLAVVNVDGDKAVVSGNKEYSTLRMTFDVQNLCKIK